MLSSRIVIIVTLSSAWMLSAQSQPPATDRLKRVPPAGRATTEKHTAAFAAVRLRRSTADSGRFRQFA